MTDAADVQDEMIAAAAGIFTTSSGIDALDRCEWEPVVDLGDGDGVRALAALFRAHGRTLAVTPALGVLAAAALEGRPTDRSARRLTVFDASVDGDRVRLTSVGGEVGAELLVDLPGEGVHVCVGSSAVVEPTEPLEPDFVQTLSVPRAALVPITPSDPDAGRRAEALVRLALAHELLGVCDAIVALATSYAHDRTQFDRPIGSFQAVQHVLAEAAVDARGLEAACALAVRRPIDLEGDDGMHLKALAGRSTRRVLQATLQTFGAIGFSWEHEHHRFTRRALTLDALGGTSEQLMRRIGDRSRGGRAHRPSAAF